MQRYLCPESCSPRPTQTPQHHKDVRQTCWVMFTQTYTDTTTPRTSDRLAGSCSPRPTQTSQHHRLQTDLLGHVHPDLHKTPQHHGLQTDLLGHVHPDLHRHHNTTDFRQTCWVMFTQTYTDNTTSVTPHGLQTDLLGHVHPDLHGLQTDLLCGLLQHYSRLTQVSEDRSFAENWTGAGCLQDTHSASHWFFTLHH